MKGGMVWDGEGAGGGGDLDEVGADVCEQHVASSDEAAAAGGNIGVGWVGGDVGDGEQVAVDDVQHKVPNNASVGHAVCMHEDDDGNVCGDPCGVSQLCHYHMQHL